MSGPYIFGMSGFEIGFVVFNPFLWERIPLGGFVYCMISTDDCDVMRDLCLG